MKKSELLQIIKEEIKSLKEGDERIFSLTPTGIKLMEMYIAGHGENIHNIFQDLTSDLDFDHYGEMVDNFINDIDPKGVEILSKAGLISSKKDSTQVSTSNFPKIKNIDGETDWRDTGEMGG